MNPRTRPNLLVEELPDETLVYDLERHRGHCLNRHAALLMAHADGKRDVSQLAKVLETSLGEPVSEEIVRLGLDRLRRAHLVEWDEGFPRKEDLSRREAIRALAAAGVSLPSVLTIAAAVAPPGTKITPASCMKDPSNLGRCCTNGRRCAQSGLGRRCAGPPC
jgi:hypothetical protein